MNRFVFMLLLLFGFKWSNAQFSIEIGSGVFWSNSEIVTFKVEPNHKPELLKRWRPLTLNSNFNLNYRLQSNYSVSLNFARQSFETSMNFCEPGANCPNYYQNNVVGIWMLGPGFSKLFQSKRWEMELGIQALVYSLQWSDADWNLTTRIWNQLPTKRVYSYRDEFNYRKELNTYMKAQISVWYKVHEKWPLHFGLQAYTGRSILENYTQTIRFRPGENQKESSITYRNYGFLSGFNLGLKYSFSS